MTELLPIGIHFGLPDVAHHADPALGSTALKSILTNAVDWQFDRLFGEERPDTKALIWGSAFHARVLEGKGVFEARYKVAPALEQFAGPKLLRTTDDIKLALAEYGLSTRGLRRKEEFITLLREVDKNVLIWDEIEADFKREVEELGVVAIDPRMLTQIETAAQWLQQHSKTGAIMKDGTFHHGAPEVTIVYEYKGVRLKARFDYLFPTLAIDLKSYRPRGSGGSLMHAIKKAIETMGYDVQAASYRRAFEAARALYEAGELKVYGTPPTSDFVDLMFAAAREQDDGLGNMVSSFRWLWVMVKASGAPQVTILEFPRELMIFEAADRDVERAIDTFISMRDKFGIDGTWRPDEQIVVLSDEDFSPYFGNYR